MLPIINLVRKFGRLTCKEYFYKLDFKSEKIKSFLYGIYGERNFSALAFIFMLAWFNQKNAGYIKGGSFPLAQRMVEKFEKLGGEILYKTKVEKIIVENNIAKGVILSDGRKILSDYVISTADGYTTIYKMLEGKYMSKKIDFAYKNWELFTPLVQVSFGIRKEVKYESPITINISKDIKIGRTQLEYGYSIMNYAYDETMAPAGNTTIVMRYESPWKLWENLEGEEYKNEKLQIEKDATGILELEYPGITDYIEVIDVATPKTDFRYTGVKEGAYEGFMPSKENMMKSLDMQLPKLKNFLMAGQWLFPGGGLPPSAQSGKWTIQLICKKEKQKFISGK
jgi:phytoene dehydrogenase-like protein